MRAYLRTMWSILWSAVLYPRHNTVIDATTGRVLYHYRPSTPPTEGHHERTE